jgi:hypothetical protein
MKLIFYLAAEIFSLEYNIYIELFFIFFNIMILYFLCFKYFILTLQHRRPGAEGGRYFIYCAPRAYLIAVHSLPNGGDSACHT